MNISQHLCQGLSPITKNTITTHTNSTRHVATDRPADPASTHLREQVRYTRIHAENCRQIYISTEKSVKGWKRTVAGTVATLPVSV